MAIGYFMLKRSNRWKDLWFRIRKKTVEFQIQQEERKTSKRQRIERDLNQILDKIHRDGLENLTSEEQERLYDSSRALSRYKKKD